MIEKILDWISKIAEFVACIMLAAMCLMVFANVLTRFVLHFAIPWSEELSRFAQIWSCFLGAAILYREDGHMGLDILVKAVPKQVARVIAIIVDLITMYLVYLIGTGGYELAKAQAAWKTPATGLSWAWVFAVIAISMGCTMIFAVDKLVWHVISLVKNEDFPRKEEKAV